MKLLFFILIFSQFAVSETVFRDESRRSFANIMAEDEHSCDIQKNSLYFMTGKFGLRLQVQPIIEAFLRDEGYVNEDVETQRGWFCHYDQISTKGPNQSYDSDTSLYTFKFYCRGAQDLVYFKAKVNKNCHMVKLLWDKLWWSLGDEIIFSG